MPDTFPEGNDSANQPVTPGFGGFAIHGSAAAVFAALAAAQADFGPIERSRTVTVTSDKGNYTFSYAPLETILSAVSPALNKRGLALLQPFVRESAGWVLRTILAHESGAYIECTMPIAHPKRSYWDKTSNQRREVEGGWQELGSAITYARRYMVGALLGIAPEEDDDGTAAEEMPREVKPRQNTRPTPPAPPAKVEPKPEPKAATSSPPPAPAAAAPAEPPKPGVAMTEGASLRVRSLVRAKAWNGQPLKPPFTDQFFRSVLGPEIGVREANASHTEALIAALESLPDVAS